jgi:hypothetical protein
MRTPRPLSLSRCLLLTLLAAGIAGRAGAKDHCSVKGTMEGQSFKLDHCAIAFYEGANSVTIWFTEKPLTAEELATFHLNSYAKQTGTMISFGFCPGGGKPVPSVSAVRDVEITVSHTSSPMLTQNWVLNASKDKDLKIEKLAGNLTQSGRLSGRIAAKKTLDQGQVYTWDADFDLELPARAAAAGLGCSGD